MEVNVFYSELSPEVESVSLILNAVPNIFQDIVNTKELKRHLDKIIRLFETEIQDEYNSLNNIKTEYSVVEIMLKANDIENSDVISKLEKLAKIISDMESAINRLETNEIYKSAKDLCTTCNLTIAKY